MSLGLSSINMAVWAYAEAQSRPRFREVRVQGDGALEELDGRSRLRGLFSRAPR
jgi:hypothetical protein